MRICAIDPGPEQSAYVLYENSKPIDFGKVDNKWLLACLSLPPSDEVFGKAGHVAIEMIASFGMPVGAEVFDTCVWVGRYIQACDRPFTLVYRKDVKLTLCNSPRANDSTIRQALIDLYGGKAKAIGSKKAPGPLKGVAGDVWSALAVALTFEEMNVP